MNISAKSLITVNISKQTLNFFSPGFKKSYFISTSKHGTGQIKDSGKTPLGKHVIYEKIGNKMPINSIFVGRVFNLIIYNDALKHSKTDWILTRILWLEGIESGFNCGGIVDTKNRYIYIHGTPYEDQLGRPSSAGCIRMANQDVIELFNNAQINTEVDIVP